MGWQLFGDRAPGASEHLGDAPARQDEVDAAFWASPVGDAARAKLRGDRFFQIELDDTTLAEYAETASRHQHDRSGRRARRTCDLLGQIEELGWHLEHVSWWRVDDTEDPTARDDAAGPDQRPDHVRGVYLFHSVDAADPHEPSAHEGMAETPAPSHRRDVAP
jgi:hypothetical protein